MQDSQIADTYKKYKTEYRTGQEIRKQRIYYWTKISWQYCIFQLVRNCYHHPHHLNVNQQYNNIRAVTRSRKLVIFPI